VLEENIDGSWINQFDKRKVREVASLVSKVVLGKEVKTDIYKKGCNRSVNKNRKGIEKIAKSIIKYKKEEIRSEIRRDIKDICVELL